MTEVITFEKALQTAEAAGGKKHLLLGNGFSMAWKPDVFSYGTLLEKAKESFKGNPSAKVIFKAFELLATKDFEEVIFALQKGAQILPAYSEKLEKIDELCRSMSEDAEKIKKCLIEVIVSNHPEFPDQITDAQKRSCAVFLSNFIKITPKESGKIFTLNYDLLLYWVLMWGTKNKLFMSDDGFRTPDGEDEVEYVEWSLDVKNQNIHYLHGALHIFDVGTELHKYTWIKTGVRLKDQITKSIQENEFPLFVSEGSKEQKLTRIKHHAYLERGLRCLSSNHGNLFIYGFAMSDSDSHILEAIKRNMSISNLFISCYKGSGKSIELKILKLVRSMNVERVEANRRGRRTKEISVYFFDAESVNVWGYPEDERGTLPIQSF